MALKGKVTISEALFNTDQVVAGGELADVKTAHVNSATAGENTLVAAVTGSKIRVLAVSVSTDTAQQIDLLDGAAGATLQTYYMGGNAPVVEGVAQGFLLETSEGNALVVNLGSANNTSVRVIYVEV